MHHCIHHKRTIMLYSMQIKNWTFIARTSSPLVNAIQIIPKPFTRQRYYYTTTTTLLSSSSRSSSSFSPFSWFRGIGKNVWRIYKGDDHINPKKILERKYIYLTLIAIQFRNLRLLDSHKSRTTDDLYEQAVDELEKQNLDKTTNVDLRLLLQQMLQPQVKQVFEGFDRVDQRLAIPQSIELYYNSNHSTETSITSIMDETFFTSTYKDILINDFDYTQQLLSVLVEVDAPVDEYKHHNQMKFLTTKEEAILSLLQYHGWDRSTDALITSPISNKSEDTDTNALDPFGMKVDDQAKSDTIKLMKQYQTVNLCRSALIRDELGYSVLSLRSSIPNAGRGLFIDGSVMAGAIVAFQPGDIWPKEHILTDAPEVMEHFADDDEECQISLRFDDYVVDARQSPVVVLCRDGSLNPWALGNMANHPNPTMIPNCQSVMLNYTAKTKLEHLVRYIPNSYAKLPTWQSTFFDLEEVVMHGLCLVSRRDAHNQELLYDYRLQSEITPDWYNIVKYENQLDEDQVVFFRDDWRDKQ